MLMGFSKRVTRLFMFFLLVALVFPSNLPVGHAAESSATSATIHGLKAEYYTNSGPPSFDFVELKATVIDPQINFPTLEGIFKTLVGQEDRVNVRWTGQITPEYSEEYTFYMIGDNGFRLWIDNQLIIDFWVNDWDKEQKSAPIYLEAGRKYDIKIEYFEDFGGSNLFLRWESASVPKQIVPQQAFTLPPDFEYSGPVSGMVLANGLVAELTFAQELDVQGDNAAEQFSVHVQGVNWPVKSVERKPDDPRTIVLTFEYPMYSKDSPKAYVSYNGGGALVNAGDGSALKEFSTVIDNFSEYQIETPWAEDVNPDNPLPEYPRPQMVREKWLNLNGRWEFQAAKPGDPLPTGQTLAETIIVPFPVESKLSGIQRNEQLMWYKRNFEIPDDWQGKRVLLNFGAVDYLATVYVNGIKVGEHKGGYTSFSFDITDQLQPGENELIVHVLDQTDAGDNQIRGKQTLNPGGIWYTSVSGIWQTVWLEPVSESRIERMEMVPDIWNEKLRLKVEVVNGADKTIEAVAFKEGVEVGRASANAGETLEIPVPEPRLWSPEDPFLYDLKVTLKDGETVLDEVDSYFGMREIKLGEVDGIKRPLLNGKFVFQMGVLDQGYWPDGLYTAPTDEALKFDIEAVKRLDMNMIRKHIKVEPARWYYWADKLGVLVWQDMPSGDNRTDEAKAQFRKEFDEMVKQLQNSPSVVVYVVFNEGWGQFDEGGPLTREMISHAINADPTRLVCGVTGWFDAGGGPNEPYAGHFIDWHRYPVPDSPTPTPYRAASLGEYGGLGLHVPGHEWSPLVFSYQLMKSKEELTNKYIDFIDIIKRLKSNPGLSAAVYTQISDVEYEINGLLSYDRKVEKIDFERVAAAHRELIGTVNKSDLLAVISDAENLLKEIKVGDGPGQYPQQAVNEFSAAIESARDVHNKDNVTSEEIMQAIEALRASWEQFLMQVHDPIPSGAIVDHFDSDQLDESWIIVNENKSRWSLAANPGYLTLYSTHGEMHERNNTLQNIFLKEVAAENFEITTKLHATVSKNHQQAGLVIFDDMDNYVKFAHVWDTVGSNGKSLETAFETNAIYRKPDYMVKHPGYDTLHLKVKKQGDVYTTYYWDGTKWLQAADPVTVQLKNPKVGIYALSALDGTDIEAKFDYFTIRELKDEPEPQPQGYATLTGDQTVKSGSTLELVYGLRDFAKDSDFAQIYAQDLTVNIDPDALEFVGAESLRGEDLVVRTHISDPGRVQIHVASKGIAMVTNGDWLKLVFVAKATKTVDTTVTLNGIVIANGEGAEHVVADVSRVITISGQTTPSNPTPSEPTPSIPDSGSSGSVVPGPVTPPKSDVVKDGNNVIVKFGKDETTKSIPVEEIEGLSLQLEAEGITLTVGADTLSKLLGQAGDVSGATFEASVVPVTEDKVLNASVQGGKAQIKVAGQAYELSVKLKTATGQEFGIVTAETGMIISMPYSAGADEELLGIYRYNEVSGTWEYVGGVADPASKRITATVDRLGQYAVLEYTKVFEDVPPGHWAARTLQILAAKHIINGTSDTHFSPNGKTTRAEFTALLVRALGLTAAGVSAPFKDVQPNKWYASEIAAAYQAGLVTGVSEDRFAPDEAITREQMAALLVRAYERLKGQIETVGHEADGLKDGANVSPWARDVVNKALAAGLMQGKGQGIFDPQGNANRAETAQAIFNLIYIQK